MSSVLVLGGGIAGLSAAWHVASWAPSVRVTLLEASGRVGGKLRGDLVAGRCLDVGAESMLARRPEGITLAREVGLADAVTNPATTQAGLWSHGRVHPFPVGTVMGVPRDLRDVAAIVGGDAAALAGQDRRPQTGAYVPPGHVARVALAADVTVADYVLPFLGQGVLDRLVDPLLGGVYAGSARTLSLQATVPALWEAARRGRNPQEAVTEAGVREDVRPVFAGLRGGVHTLPAAVAAALTRAGVEVRTGRIVTGLTRTGRGWSVTCGPTAPDQGGHAAYEADAVVLALPAAPGARLLLGTSPAAAGLLADIEYASLAIVTYAFPRRLMPALDGSGVLVPAVEGMTVKAATFSTNKWRWLEEAEPRLTFVRVSMGRHGEQRTLQRPDADLVESGLADLARLVGAALPVPVDALVTRWGGALPQYAVGHVERVSRIRAELASAPGLELCGAAYDGVGIPASIASGRVAAAAVLRHLSADGLRDR